ncbi:MAG: tetratricopeptide repeat protein [Verrucomicrobiota bacterium]|nr:tetratricopeptide repeat protein [Limisphaera sp.]MDW8382973.1 tetratricopeptide repeat protein [Verrucomicrobiota bacterium]
MMVTGHFGRVTFVALALAWSLGAGCATAPRWRTWASWLGSRDPHAAALQARIEADAHFAEGALSETQGDIPRALAAFRRALEADPQDEELALEVGRRFLRYQQAAAALTVLDRFAGSSRRPDLHLLRAEALLQQDRSAEAFQALLDARRLGATPAALLPLLGALLQRQGTLPVTLQPLALLQALMDSPEADVESLLILADWYTRLGMMTPAERTRIPERLQAVAERVAALQPGTPEQQFALGELFLRVGQSAEALVWYERARQQAPAQSHLQRMILARLADLYVRSGRNHEAAEVLGALAGLDPLNVQVHFALGNLALEGGRPAEAADAYQRALALNPKLEAAYYNLAQVYLTLNRPEQALTVLEQARQQIGQTFFVEYLSGLARSQQRDYRAARQHFIAAEVIANATDTNRLTAALYFQLGVTAERTGDIPGAVRAFERCLALDPGFHPAQNYLGYMWAERGENLDRARKLIEEAVRADPRNSAYLDSMAWVLFQLGQPAEALPWMERALEHMDEPDATLWDHYGDILAALGRMEEARQAWKRALQLEPENARLRQKMESAPTAAGPLQSP